MERHPPRILIIDDDNSIVEIISDALQMSGYTVSVACDGNEGLLQQRSVPADLLIVDMYMPEMDGIEVIKALRMDFPELILIAMSGGGRLPGKVPLFTAAAIGANAILSKPFEIVTLLDLVSDQLQKHGLA